MTNRNRVLEETWEVQRYVVEMAGDAGRQLGQFVDDADDPDWPSCDRDRAQLAAVAPEMARLLLDMRGAGLLPGAMEDRMEHVLRKAGVIADKEQIPRE